MDGVPAVWRVTPGADLAQVEEVIGRLAERLQIDPPEIQNDCVLLPAEYPHVAQALDEVEPGWRDEALLLPPEP